MRPLPRHRQHGFAILGYVLASIILMGVLAAMMALSSNRASASDQQWSASAQLVAQANLFRTKILDCAGQNGTNTSTFHPAYPDATTATALSTLTCPYSAASLFSGTDGIFIPPPPSDFTAWTYTNTTSAVTLQISASDASMATALTQAANQLGLAAVATTTSLTLTIAK